MRKVILGAGISLDGYIARRDSGIGFLRPPKGYSMSAFFATLDTVVFGRKTFAEAVNPFFPSGFPQRDFKLVDSKSYEPEGFLELKYARTRL